VLTAHDFLWGIIAPAVLAAVAMVLAYLPRRKERSAQPWGAAVSVGVGFAIAFVAIRGKPAIPPVAVDGWLMLMGLVAAIVGVIATAAGQRGRLGSWILSVAVLVVTAWLVMRPRSRNLSPQEFWIAVSVAAGGMILWWIAVESLASRVTGMTMPLVLSITALASGAALMNAGSQAFGQLAGAIGVTLAAIAVMLLWMRGATISHGGVLAVAVLLLGLLICGQFYDLSLSHLILLAAAPLTAWLGEIKPLDRKPFIRFGVRMVALLIVLAIPLVLAIKGLKKTMNDQTESYQY
jgi:hypothetical protein